MTSYMHLRFLLVSFQIAKGHMGHIPYVHWLLSKCIPYAFATAFAYHVFLQLCATSKLLHFSATIPNHHSISPNSLVLQLAHLADRRQTMSSSPDTPALAYSRHKTFRQPQSLLTLPIIAVSVLLVSH